MVSKLYTDPGTRAKRLGRWFLCSLLVPSAFALTSDETGTVEGIVQMDSARMAGFKLRLRSKSHSLLASADSAGHFKFGKVEPGEYRLEPVDPVCAVPVRKVKVKVWKGVETHADLELKRGGENCVVE